MELTASQRKAVDHVEGPLLVLAGPGSGKTRVITARVCALIEKGVAPWNICAITFTNKAAEEMKQRVLVSGIGRGSHISTFHSLCVQLLRTYADLAGVGSNFSIYDDADQGRCVKAAIKDAGVSTTDFQPAAVLAGISRRKNDLEDVVEVRERAADFRQKTFARIWERYQKILSANNALDFDDLLVKTAILLRDYPSVREELGRRFRFLLVDEYQDTNHAQYQIARGLAMEHGNICVTGDPDQSIYRWRGADIGNILAFEKDYPGATVVRLEENFRSTAAILAVADRLIALNSKRKAKRLVATIPDGDDVVVQGYGDDGEEAAAVAAKMKAAIDARVDPREMAVFYRVNSMSRPLEEAFIRERIPYQVVRGVEFYGRKEIRDMIAYLKVLANPSDEVALTRIINTPARGIGDTTLGRVRGFAQAKGLSFFAAVEASDAIETIAAAARGRLKAFAAMIGKFRENIDGPVAPLMEAIFKETGLERSLAAGKDEEGSAADNVRELIRAAAMYDENAGQPSLTDYLQQIALYSDTDAYDADAGKVALMTLHAAKGLEFDHVHIIGAEEGILPHERIAASDDELEEERRLMFVGITRARKTLEISFAKHRMVRGQYGRTIPSQFLYETGVEIRQPAGQEGFFDPYSREIEGDHFIGRQKGRRAGRLGGASGLRRDRQQTPHRPSPPQREAGLSYEPVDDDGHEALFRPNEPVRHPKFGPGRVVSFQSMGDSSTVTVRFNTAGTKTLMLKFARLTRAGDYI